MGNRAINFITRDVDSFYFNFGTYSLFLYYANQLDQENAEILYKATLTEYFYRVEYNLPKEDLTVDDITAHFDTDELLQAISFIQNSIIPSINSESQNLLEKYGGSGDFYNLMWAEQGFLANLSVYKNEYYDDDNSFISDQLNQFSVFLQSAVTANIPYLVYIQ